MSFALDIGLSYARNAGADLSARLFCCAHVDTDGDIVGAGAADHVLGIITEAAAENSPVTVQIGGIARALCGDTVAAGVRLMAEDTTNRVIPATTGKPVLGIALEGGADGEVIAVALIPGYIT